MDNGLEEDTIYANDDTSDLINVSELLKTSSLEELLKQDRDTIKEKESDLQWYHGRIARDAAEDILKKGLIKYGNIDGLYLVRESSFSTSSFVLSLVCKGSFYHFQINEVKAAHFSIDEGPVTQGLDNLIKYYREHAEGLPTKLIQPCLCKAPPDEHRFSGATNLLHRAVLENVVDVVTKIAESKYCPNLNAKNEWGSTAVHDACKYGFEDITDLLIRRGADVNIFNKKGETPLHTCCSYNKAGTISILVLGGKADVNKRNPKSDWTPLHQAAFKGSLECIKLLLDFHAPYLPRTEDGTTPLDYAENYRNIECFKMIESFSPQKIHTHKEDWFHKEIDRQGAQKLLELKGLREGLFLIRSSKKNPNWHVLTLCHNQKVFNYEIKTANYRDKMMYYIDDGPFYRNLDHLIHYYSFNANGLPCRIHVFINKARELIQITDDDEYSNLVDHDKKLQQSVVSPALPPRPESEVVEYAISAKRASTGPAGQEAPKLPSTPPSLTPPSTPKAINPPPPPNHPPPARQQSLGTELTQLDCKQISLGNEIGQGEFGKVLKGVYKRKKKEKVDVAIKLFHKTAINNQQDFLKEALTMQQLHHQNIVNFIGIAESEKHELMLVEEYITMGSMLDYLIDYKEKIDKKELYLWASQIAAGMMYLEKQKFVHRDLAARNILLQTLPPTKNKKRNKISDYEAKISDFGLSRAVGQNSDYYQATTGGRWPIKWYAPECVNYGTFSHASDVWSFGVTLWEMFSFGEPPYGDMKGIEVIKFIEDNQRLEKPEKCPDVTYEQMLNCWQKEAKKRPSFEMLNDHFQSDKEYMSIQELREKKGI